MMKHYSVIIPARNEGEKISYVLKNLWRQSLKPYRIVVVDDSSEDDTMEIAKGLGADVISVKRKSKVYATGHPYLAYIFNKGFESVEDDPIDYVLISGAECIYPKDYMKQIIDRMANDLLIVVASGISIGEFAHRLGVRGAGRVINAYWFRKVGFRYPLNYGFEPWLLYKALSMGYKISLYNDIKFYLMRRTKINERKAYLWGKAIKALGYWTPYAFSRILNFYFKKMSYGCYMLKGYLQTVSPYEDISDFVKYQQMKSSLNILLSYLIKK